MDNVELDFLLTLIVIGVVSFLSIVTFFIIIFGGSYILWDLFFKVFNYWFDIKKGEDKF